MWLAIKIGMYFLLNHLVITRYLQPINIGDFVQVKAIFLRRLLQPILQELTIRILVRDIVIRVWFTLNAIWTPILLLDCVHTGLAIFFIYVIRTDIPDDWPDLFASPLEAYTIGRFWSR